MEETWSSILKANPTYNFLQSPLWGEVNRLLGHKLVVRTFENKALYLGIVKDAKRGRYLEIPGGPVVDVDGEVRSCDEVHAANRVAWLYC